MGKSPPPQDLTDYQIARAFYSTLGVTEEALDTWDEDRVQRWLIVMDVVAKHDAAMAERERALQRQANGQTGDS
jgi:hypothetical protein